MYNVCMYARINVASYVQRMYQCCIICKFTYYFVVYLSSLLHTSTDFQHRCRRRLSDMARDHLRRSPSGGLGRRQEQEYSFCAGSRRPASCFELGVECNDRSSKAATCLRMEPLSSVLLAGYPNLL